MCSGGQSAEDTGAQPLGFTSPRFHERGEEPLAEALPAVADLPLGGPEEVAEGAGGCWELMARQEPCQSLRPAQMRFLAREELW